MDDTIRRQWLMECVNEGWIKFDTEKDENRFIHLVRDIAPSVEAEPCEDAVSREAVSEWLKQYGQDVLHGKYKFSLMYIWKNLMGLPSAQPDIKQAAKLLSDFIESCPGGGSYLITPDGEELRTDWGYVMDGVQLIYDWAERRTDE